MSKARSGPGARVRAPAMAGRRQGGAAMVEAGFVMGPALLLIVGVLEMALVFLTATSLQAAVSFVAQRARLAPLLGPDQASTAALWDLADQTIMTSGCSGVNLAAYEYETLSWIATDWEPERILGWTADEVSKVNIPAYLGPSPPFDGVLAAATEMNYALIEINCTYQFLSRGISDLMGEIDLGGRAVIAYEPRDP